MTFLLIAVMAVPALILLLIEGALRLAGFGYETDFFLARKENGQTVLVQNDNFGWQFFPRELARNPTPTRFRQEKDPGTIRIFVFGESAALGDPKPGFGMGRYLQMLLQERFPGQKFEVIAAAMTALNSHALLPIARECARLNGDYWIIYMGNNEMAGPFGANPLSGVAAPNLRLVRATLALRRTKTGQLLDVAAQKIARKKATQSWEGMRMFVEHQVPPDDARKERVYTNFEQNLREILAIGLRNGVKPILCTVASNLKDCAPFASSQNRPLNPQDKKSWAEFFARGKEFEKINDFTDAADAYRQALKFDEQFAELHFRLAASLLSLGNLTNARPAFEKARDLDALPFRADTRMNRFIRDLGASSQGAQLLDLEEALAGQTGSGVTGDEIFYDHVHFDFTGNYRAARLIAAKLEETLPAKFSENRSSTWAPAAACEQRLGLTDWNRRAASEQMLQRLSEPPFINRANQQSSIEALARKIIDLRKKTAAADPAELRSQYEEAIRNNPADFRLHENFAEFLESTGQFGEAASQWQAIVEILPGYYGGYFQTGRLLSKAKQYDAAAAQLRKAMALRPSFPEGQIELGLLKYREGKPDEALHEYQEARKLRPRDARLMIHIADALAAQNKRQEAMDALRQAIAINPDFWEPHYLLGVELASHDNISEALTEFQWVVRLRPDFAQGHFNLAVALAKIGQLKTAGIEFQETLRLDPGHKAATAYLEQLQRGGKKSPN